jgi:molybdate transport system substrate-binding protein
MPAEIKVMASAAMKAAYLALVPEFESDTGHRVATSWLPTVQIMSRLRNGEAVDLLVMAASSIDELIATGNVQPGGRVDLARCGVGLAVRAGAAKPDISSPEALKQALLAAESIAYSTGPSGVHVVELIQRMGIYDELRSRMILANAEPTGALVARGEAQIAFQQVCELLPVPGIAFVGPLPAAVQKITTFSAGVHVNARQADAAKALIDFIIAPAAAPVIRQKGMTAC